MGSPKRVLIIGQSEECEMPHKALEALRMEGFEYAYQRVESPEHCEKIFGQHFDGLIVTDVASPDSNTAGQRLRISLAREQSEQGSPTVVYDALTSLTKEELRRDLGPQVTLINSVYNDYKMLAYYLNQPPSPSREL